MLDAERQEQGEGISVSDIYTQAIADLTSPTASPVAREDLFAICHYIGDPQPIATWLGIEYTPPSLPKNLDLSEEWRLTVVHAKQWIRATYERIYPVQAIAA